MAINDTLRRIEQASEMVTGRTVDVLRDTPLSELRRQTEEKYGRPMEITGVASKTVDCLGSPVRVIYDPIHPSSYRT